MYSEVARVLVSSGAQVCPQMKLDPDHLPEKYIPLTISYHLYFSVSLKVRAYCIRGHWGEFRIKNATLCLHTPF